VQYLFVNEKLLVAIDQHKACEIYAHKDNILTFKTCVPCCLIVFKMIDDNLPFFNIRDICSFKLLRFIKLS